MFSDNKLEVKNEPVEQAQTDCLLLPYSSGSNQNMEFKASPPATQLPENFYDKERSAEWLIADCIESFRLNRSVIEQPITILTKAIGNVTHIYGNFPDNVIALLLQTINPLFEPGEYKAIHQNMKQGAINEGTPAVGKMADSLMYLRCLFEQDSVTLQKYFSAEIAQLGEASAEKNLAVFSRILKKIVAYHVTRVLTLIDETVTLDEELHAKITSCRISYTRIYHGDSLTCRQFRLPVAGNGVSEQYIVTIGMPATKNPLHFQSKSLYQTRGWIIPSKIMGAVDRLLALSKINGINFVELAAFALDDFALINIDEKSSGEDKQHAISAFSFLQEDLPVSQFFPALYTKARNFYEKQEDKSYAVYRLCLAYEYGYGVAQNEEKALDFLQMAAEQKEPRALFHLAGFYRKGARGLKQDEVKACDYLVTAAALGEGNALLELAIIMDANAVLRDVIMNQLWAHYEAQVKEENSTATLILGFLTLFYLEDVEKAAPLLEKAAQLGSAAGYYQLGFYYERSLEADIRNLGKTIDYYELAAQAGHLYAAERLGALYAGTYSYFTETNAKKSAFYYELAAQQGSAQAQAALAFLHWREFKFGHEAKAIEYTELHLAGRDPKICNSDLNIELCDIFATWHELVQHQYDDARELYLLDMSEKQRSQAPLDCFTLSAFAEFYEKGLGTLKADSSKALQLCNYVLQKGADNLALAGFAYYIKGQTLFKSAKTSEKEEAQQLIMNSAKIYLKRVKDDKDNISAVSYYRLGEIIKGGYLNKTALAELELNPDADYYYTKAAQMKAEYFYPRLYVQLAQKRLPAKIESALSKLSFLAAPADTSGLGLSPATSGAGITVMVEHKVEKQLSPKP